MRNRTPAQAAAAIIGIVFVLVGILGFIPGITTNYDELGFIDHNGAELLGLFEVNALHNIAHLALGIVGLALAGAHRTAVQYLIGGGIVYAALLVFGLLVDHGSEANFIAINNADNILHAGLAVAMIGLGVALSRDPRATGDTSRAGADRVSRV
jgi:hypothetical protein